MTALRRFRLLVPLLPLLAVLVLAAGCPPANDLPRGR